MSYEVVIGIDFGTSGIGYAYSFKNPKKIEIGKFFGQNTGIKVPNEIILDSKLENVLSFGLNCCDYKLESGDLYFKKIKMNIYHNKKNITPDNSSRSFPLIDVIIKIFEYIKKAALKQVNEEKPYLTEDKVKWIVTVPAIWGYEQKSVMISACEKVGLINANTDRANFLALEPEVASLYCSFDESIDHNYLKPEKTFIVCDLGGGTGDMVTHYKKSEEKIDEKYFPIGGAFGSEEIDNEIFDKVFKNIFGFGDFNSLKEKFNRINFGQEPKPAGFDWKENSLYTEWHELQDKINIKKRITFEKKDQSFNISCQIFKDFTDGAGFRDLIEKFNASNPNGWKLGIQNESIWFMEFPNKIIYDIIETHASKIANEITEICKKVKGVESILYVGGYCSNDILISSLKKKFPNLVHLKPSIPERAVVYGAVLYGLDPSIINIRKAVYTIGFNCDDIWDEKIHGGKGNKIYDPEFNVYKCENSFHAFIRRGQDLSQNNYVVGSFIAMNTRVILLKFFKSLKEYPVLWNEEGVELIGEQRLDLGKEYPKKENTFTLHIKFGGTYADAVCIHDKSNCKLSFPLYFNN